MISLFELPRAADTSNPSKRCPLKDAPFPLRGRFTSLTLFGPFEAAQRWRDFRILAHSGSATGVSRLPLPGA